MRAWVLEGRTLALSGADGATVPDADSVFRSVVEGQSVWADVEPGPTGAASSLRASKYPVVVNVSLELDEAGAPATTIAGRVKGQTLAVAIDDLRAGHFVESGTWYPLDPASSAEVLSLANRIGLTLGPLGSIRQFLDLKKASAEGGPVQDQTAGIALPPMLLPRGGPGAPEGVRATLYPYQTDGWRWLAFLMREGIGGFLADEMGLGKTLQVISLIADPGPDRLGPAMIIAPGSLLENWCRELTKFAPGLQVLKHHGPHRTGRPADFDGFDVIVTSYDNAIRDQSLFLMIEWAAVVLDEAQYIRNPDAQRTRSVKRLRRKAGIAVTGTPVENRLLDLWSIMDFVLPGYLGTAAEFERHFGDEHDGAFSLEPFVSPVLLRRRVADVATDLPERIDIPQVIELDDDEARRYDEIRQEIAAKYAKAATLVALTALRQFCAHPFLLDNQRGDPASFSKFRRLDDILGEIFARDEKATLFTSYNAMSDILQDHISRTYGAFTGAIDGRLAIPERQPLIDRFSETKGAAALVLNPRAGGAGLNITAANHVIHYNLEWNPALEDQASARAYRRGQDLPVTVHRLFCAGTVEEIVDQRLTRKRTISDAAIVGVEGAEDDYADVIAALGRSPLAQKGA